MQVILSMKTVLVAEDRESSRELIRTMLEHSGFAVIEASNGGEAILLAREKHPDLVLLDLQMPIKDGFDVLQELRADPCFQSIPIIALTASAMYRDKERALERGFTGYLTKPLNLAELRQELSRLLPK
jgi:two-component system cell cycle response regulator DivK